MNPGFPLQLRLAAHLLFGIVRIYARKAKYLLSDSSDALIKLRVAFQSKTNVDLREKRGAANIASITLTTAATVFSSKRKRSSLVSKARREGLLLSPSARAGADSSLLTEALYSPSGEQEDESRFEEIEPENDIEASQSLLQSSFTPPRESETERTQRRTRTSVGARDSLVLDNDADLTMEGERGRGRRGRTTRRSLSAALSREEQISVRDDIDLIAGDIGADLGIGADAFGEDLLMSFEIEEEAVGRAGRTGQQTSPRRETREGEAGDSFVLSPPPSAGDAGRQSLDIEVARAAATRETEREGERIAWKKK